MVRITVSAKAAFAKYSPPRFLPFTSNTIFPAMETNSVLLEKADFRGRRLSGSLVFFHHCDVDYFTVDPKRKVAAVRVNAGNAAQS